MKILIAHNFYQLAGGEDQVFADETNLLRSRGHEVIHFTVHNDQVEQTARLTLAGKTIWNRQSHEQMTALVQQHQPAVVHFHNTFPLLSPSVYSAAKKAGAAVVQTLHNYRLLCPAATFYRDGHVCQDCLGKTFPWPAVAHACYREDRAASGITAAMLAWNRIRGTYRNDVDRYIALTEFARGQMLATGIDPDRIVVKPNFVDADPGIGTGSGGFALFVGRLVDTKGVPTLLEAWKRLKLPLKLKIAGDGELAPAVKAAAAVDPRIEYLGRQPMAEIYRLMQDAAVLIFPSVWFEGMPKTIVEAFATGTPVIASDLGSMAELIDPQKTGWRFTPGDAASLVSTIDTAFANPDNLAAHRQGARAEYESRYTADANCKMLIDIYNQAIHCSNPSRT